MPARRRSGRALRRWVGEAFETLPGGGEQFGDGGAVPVGVGDPGVAEVGCESQDLAIYICAFLVPVQQPAHDEGVAPIPISE